MKELQPFHIGIKAVIVNNEKALVLKDKARYNGIDLPGGKIDQGEKAGTALARELHEELGIGNFRVLDLLHAQERPDYKRNGARLMLIFYKVEADLEEIKLSDEHTSFEWVGREDLNDLEFRNDGVKTAIEKAL